MHVRLLEVATFLTIFVMTFQYFFNHFLSSWYRKHLEKKGIKEPTLSNDVESLKAKVRWGILSFLIVCFLTALIGLFQC